MKTWVVANQKGGVGKTTTAIAIAGLLSEQNKRVLLVDLDPHASATHYFNYEPDALDVNLYHCFIAEKIDYKMLAECILSTNEKSLDLLPSSLALATLDKSLGTQKGMGLKLKVMLNLLENEYDYAIVDCPPLLGVLMINALAACQQLIVPVQTEYLAIKGLERMLKTIAMVYKQPQSRPSLVIVPTMFDRRTRASVTSLRSLRKDYAEDLWRTVVPVDTQFRDASQAHLIPSKFSPESRGIIAYEQLLRDIIMHKINQSQKLRAAI